MAEFSSSASPPLSKFSSEFESYEIEGYGAKLLIDPFQTEKGLTYPPPAADYRRKLTQIITPPVVMAELSSSERRTFSQKSKCLLRKDFLVCLQLRQQITWCPPSVDKSIRVILGLPYPYEDMLRRYHKINDTMCLYLHRYNVSKFTKGGLIQLNNGGPRLLQYAANAAYISTVFAGYLKSQGIKAWSCGPDYIGLETMQAFATS